MTTTRSMFTEAIEDHLALKKQNSSLSTVMPLAAFDVGDPLDRYPGGPVSPAADEQTLPSVDQAVATTEEILGGHVVEGAFRPPLQPLSGMTPMLSLVEDVEDDNAIDGSPTLVNAANSAAHIGSEGSVVRFPGGVGPRITASAGAADKDVADETGDYPVIVIDAEEPLSNAFSGEVEFEPRSAGGERIKRPSFFGGLRKRKQRVTKDESWFTASPRDFDWKG